MKLKHSRRPYVLVLLLLSVVTLCFSEAEARDRWTTQEAWDWYDAQPWMVGANWLPSYAVNPIEVWQADTLVPAANTFDLDHIKGEFDIAQNTGMNTLRIFMSYEVWKADRNNYMTRVEQVVDAADKRGIKPMFVLWCDVNFDQPNQPTLGEQAAPETGKILSRWTGIGQDAVRDNPGNWELDRTNSAAGSGSKQYVQDIVGTYATDDRVQIWDLYNEPSNGGAGAGSLPLIQASVEWAREMDPIQPIAPNAWGTNYTETKDLSDIINIHEYHNNDQANTSSIDGRPVIVSEWMYRSDARPDIIMEALPRYHARKIGAWQWGLVNGDGMTQYPWWSTTDDDPWFHDLYHRDGTPYNQAEVDLYVKLSNTAVPTMPTSTGLINNGTFETNPVDNGAPEGWTKDFNSYGTYTGAAATGNFGMHPGASYGTGGAYQDLATEAGETYKVTLWIQNHIWQEGTSHLRVLIGDDGTDTVAVDDQGNSTSLFSSTGLIDLLFATDEDGYWSKITFQFTALDETTRFALYNAYMTGDTLHAVAIDDVSVELVPEPATMLVLAAGLPLLLKRRRRRVGSKQ
ncbi:MAG: cellulase family glycosylhydrolase [bacterium]|nr:cellulase family glycosylhydrolase [bacterium]